MSDILTPDYERKLKQPDSVESYNKRVRDAKYPVLENCLYLWNCEMLRKNLPVANELLLEKAKEFGDILGNSTLLY